MSFHCEREPLRDVKQDVRCEIIEDNYHALTEQELGETAISLDTSKE